MISKPLLHKLEDVQEIEDYYINTFLVKASEQDARAVVSLLLTRIRQKDDEGAQYDALPVLGFRKPAYRFGRKPRPRDHPARDT